ncbi:ABC transporter permease [Clostridiaceae bacterium M8S5]|nr:ABC transporter permease [Clostridiaceae bacterium M8S5]
MISRLVKIELFKFRKNLLYKLTLIVPLFISSLFYIDILLRKETIIKGTMKYYEISELWRIALIENFYMNGWGLVLPAIVVMMVYMSNTIEKQNNTLKLILARPISKMSFIISKFIAMAIWTLVIVILTYISVLIVADMNNMLSDIDYYQLSIYIASMILAVVALISFQQLVAIVLKSEIAAMVIGLIASFGSIMVLQSPLLPKIIPYAYIFRLEPSSDRFIVSSCISSVACIVISLSISSIVFNREDVR